MHLVGAHSKCSHKLSISRGEARYQCRFCSHSAHHSRGLQRHVNHVHTRETILRNSRMQYADDEI